MAIPRKSSRRAEREFVTSAERGFATSAERGFELTALVLQGGGALGAYQGGALQGLDEARISIDWVAGISIGAINAAIIAGNSPSTRCARLREFWDTVSDPMVFPALDFPPSMPPNWFAERHMRELQDFAAASIALTHGQKGFFSPRVPPPWLQAPGSAGATSFYDTAPLRETLMRLVSNAPIEYVLDFEPRRDTLCFQVDLWSARGPMPRDLLDVLERQKDIQFSSRTRRGTDRFERRQTLRHQVNHMLSKLPTSARRDPALRALEAFACDRVSNVIQEHWVAGLADMQATLAMPKVLDRPHADRVVVTHDVHRPRPSQQPIGTTSCASTGKLHSSPVPPADWAKVSPISMRARGRRS